MTINSELSIDSSALNLHRVTSQDRQLGRKRLLLADDLPSIRDSLSRLLRHQGYNIVLAENGREAVERVTEERLDLVLLDLSMPELNGWEALKCIAALKPALPVVILTAHRHQRSWVEPSGAWSLLEKPLAIPLLLATIRELTDASPSRRTSKEADRKARFTHYPSARTNDSTGLLSRSGINE